MTFVQAVAPKRGYRSSVRPARPVKLGSHPARSDRSQSRLPRHLEGWPLGVLSLGIAVLAAGLGVPRPAVPDVVPPPQVDAAELGRAATERRELAQEALVRPLSFEVRSLGELIRRYGRATRSGQTGEAAGEAARLPRLAAGIVATEGHRSLLILRAVQTELFLMALLRREASGRADDDLIELGGDFLTKAHDSGWIHERLLMSTEERAVLFGMRWTSLLKLKDSPLGPTQNDWRLYYRFLLEHPEGAGNRSSSDKVAQQLQVVRALAKRDPDYPAALAEGVLLVRRGDLAAARDAFRAYLSSSPDGAWQLRARNYLRACEPGAQSAWDSAFP